MRNILKTLFLITLVPLLCGCDAIEAWVEKIVEKKQSQIGQRISEKIDNIEKRLLKNEFDIALIDQTSISVSTLQRQYSVISNQHGVFYVLVDDLSPHLDGYKVKIHIGNSTTAMFHGVDLEIGWGLEYGAGKPLADVEKSRKSKKFTLTDDFAPGAYTAVNVVLTPAIAEEVKSLTVKLEFNRLSLKSAKKP